ncbi:MAG: GGDEF domain-containing protein [Deltaproteobacteria bacterium]|nr:MAG: GGDEF domain-containing protein [Deltaproteobacteria bacterium]
MKKNVILLKIENNGLIIISAILALIYWHVESLHLGAVSTRAITFSFFIVYGVFTQYFINSNKRMATEISTLSMTDHLTGLYNRRGFMTLAEQHLKMAERTKRGVLLLLFADLDHMKSINDKLGHEKGDKALIEVASILKEVFRESDIIARVGGDEFAILGIGATINAWGGLESRLQQQIDIHNALENRDYMISLSVGVAYSNLDDNNPIDEMMSRADKLMYKHKQSKLQ